MRIQKYESEMLTRCEGSFHNLQGKVKKFNTKPGTPMDKLKDSQFV